MRFIFLPQLPQSRISRLTAVYSHLKQGLRFSVLPSKLDSYTLSVRHKSLLCFTPFENILIHVMTHISFQINSSSYYVICFSIQTGCSAHLSLSKIKLVQHVNKLEYVRKIKSPGAQFRVCYVIALKHVRGA